MLLWTHDPLLHPLLFLALFLLLLLQVIPIGIMKAAYSSAMNIGPDLDHTLVKGMLVDESHPDLSSSFDDPNRLHTRPSSSLPLKTETPGFVPD